MSGNENGYELLKRNSIMRSNNLMCGNGNEKVLNLVRMDMNVDWCLLCSNRNGVKYIRNMMKNLGEDCWSSLCKNPNPEVIEILKKNKSKIDWEILSENSIIFEYDYDGMKREKHDINKELIEYIYKPENMCKWKDWRLEVV